MSQRLRLGYFIPQFPSQTHIFFWRELEALEKLGVIPKLLSTTPPPPRLVVHSWSAAAVARTTYLVRRDIWAARDTVTRASCKAILQGLAEASGLTIKDAVLAMPAAQALVRVAKQEGIGHVHVHSCGRAALIAALAFKLGGPPYSLSLHGPLHDYGPGQRFKWRNAAFSTVITEKLQDEVLNSLAGFLPPSVVVQAMGVDTDRMSRDTPWQPPASGEPVRIFSCGRLNPVKGHQDLLEALKLLGDKGIDATLLIAGEDDKGGRGYRLALEKSINAMGLAPRVRLLGAVPEQEVRRQLLQAHVFVLASWHEPLGVALMEAMACEVPTIATASGGVAELICHGTNGLLVSPKNPAGLAEAIHSTITNPDKARRLGEAARRHIVSRFGACRSAEMLVKMIGETGSGLWEKVADPAPCDDDHLRTV